MTNYRKITGAMPRELAKILAGFNKDEIIDWYCKNCKKEHDGCPIEDETDICPISNEECVMRWLNSSEAK